MLNEERMQNCIYVIIYIPVKYEYEKKTIEKYTKDKYFCKKRRKHSTILSTIIFLSKHQLVYLKSSFLHIKLFYAYHSWQPFSLRPYFQIIH